jgi:hypothetical protein
MDMAPPPCFQIDAAPCPAGIKTLRRPVQTRPPQTAKTTSRRGNNLLKEHGFQSDRKFENRGSMFIDPTQDLRESLGERSMQAEDLNAAPAPLIPNRHVL